jgi:hypothetical protein
VLIWNRINLDEWIDLLDPDGIKDDYGVVHVSFAKGRRYRIKKVPGEPPYIASYTTKPALNDIRIIGSAPTLELAKALCEQHARLKAPGGWLPDEPSKH